MPYCIYKGIIKRLYVQIGFYIPLEGSFCLILYLYIYMYYGNFLTVIYHLSSIFCVVTLYSTRGKINLLLFYLWSRSWWRVAYASGSTGEWVNPLLSREEMN